MPVDVGRQSRRVHLRQSEENGVGGEGGGVREAIKKKIERTGGGGDICDNMNRYVTRREGEKSNNKSADKHIGN